MDHNNELSSKLENKMHHDEDHVNSKYEEDGVTIGEN